MKYTLYTGKIPGADDVTDEILMKDDTKQFDNVRDILWERLTTSELKVIYDHINGGRTRDHTSYARAMYAEGVIKRIDILQELERSALLMRNAMFSLGIIK